MTKLSKISTVIFDIGGTLIHINSKVFEQYIRKHDPTYSISVNFRKIDIEAKKKITTDNKKFVEDYFGEILDKISVDQEIKKKVLSELSPLAYSSSKEIWNDLDPFAVDTLNYLSKKYKLGIISNNVGDAETMLQTAGIYKFFDKIVDSKIYGTRKPDPRIFLHAAEELKTSPKTCVYVGDVFDWDAVGALNSGMTPILVYAPKSAFRFSVITIENLSGLKNLL